jgi:hypothetical protein
VFPVPSHSTVKSFASNEKSKYWSNKNKLKPRTPKWKSKGYKKKAACDLCGFKGLFTSQITVFHVDGNLENTDLVNLRSICLNCVEVVKKKEITWKRGDLEIDY